ncbi:hypothetical protein GALMADRAFT_15425, partial [Galerina marginata CBS 339.88]
LHLVFNVIKLTPTPEDPIPGHKSNPPLPLELIDGEEYYEEYKIEGIIGHKCLKSGLRFLVRWEGYGPQFDTWATARDLKNAPQILREYKKTH